MRKVVFFLSIMALAASALAQWEYSHYDVYPDQMFDCACVDSSTFWAVGSFGYVIKSTDSGRTWSQFSYAHLTDALYEVSFPDLKHGFAASQYGVTVIATSDSGNTWQIACQNLLVNRISGLKFVDSLNGYISGANTIYRTTDGGFSWTAPDSFILGFSTIDLFIVNKDTAWACGHTGNDPYMPLIIKTTDGGHLWNIITAFGDTLDGHVRSIAFLDGSYGWATVQPTHSYDNYLYKTIDSGQSWSLIWIAHEGNDSAILKKIFALDSLHLKIISDVGNIRSSSDGGYTWNVEFRGYTGLMQAISMYDSTHGLVVGGPISDNTPLLLYYNSNLNEVDNRTIAPQTFEVSETYPNPFNSSCTWKIKEVPDEIIIYDVTGALIKKIAPLSNLISWDGKNNSGQDASSGIYFSMFKKGGMRIVKKAVKLK